jgi:hypothetical protein
MGWSFTTHQALFLALLPRKSGCNDPGFYQILGENFCLVLLEMIEISQGF